MNRWLAIALRIGGGVVATVIFWWWGIRFLGIGLKNPLLLVGWLVFTGVLGLLFFGLPVVAWLGEKAGNLYAPSDNAFAVRPQYSIAEARVAQGRYVEAVAAFRADSNKFPGETYPHIRIAELLLEKLHDADAALAELQAALLKAHSEDAFVLVASRLAEWLVQLKQDRAGAVAVLNQIEARYPGTKHARAARERLARLQ
jgi:hypothetical protein